MLTGVGRDDIHLLLLGGLTELKILTAEYY